jgi:phosphatidylserine synthase
MPTPGAAAFIAAIVLTAPYAHDNYGIVVLATVALVVSAYLMVSTIEFLSIKQLKLSGIKLRGRIFIGLIIALVWKSPSLGLLALSGAYVASGPYLRIRHKLPLWLGGIRPVANIS